MVTKQYTVNEITTQQVPVPDFVNMTQEQWWEALQIVVKRTLEAIPPDQENIDLEALEAIIPYETIQAEIDALIKTFDQPKKKRIAHPRTHSKSRALLTVRSDILSRMIEKGLSSREEFQTNEENLRAHSIQRFEINKQKGQIILTIPVDENDTWDTVTDALQVLGDTCIDTFYALVAIGIEKHGVNSMRTAIDFSPDNILEMLGKKKSNGSYTAEQRKEVMKHIKLLSHVHLTATVPSLKAVNRRGRSITEQTIKIAKGAILDLLSFELTEYSAITGEELSTMHSVCFGPWADAIPGITDKTALMPAKVLAYSAKNQLYQKKLGRYLTKMFRINARRSRGEFPRGISMKSLFEGSRIEPHRKRGEFKDAIDKALAQLKEDDVIGSYAYEPIAEGIKLRIEQRARGWFDDYLDLKINFTPPNDVLEHYKSFIKIEQEDCAEGDEGM